MKQKLTTAVAAALVAGLAALGGAVAAEAGVHGDYTKPGVQIRAKGLLTSPLLGRGNPGQGAVVYCKATGGSSVDGSTIWYRHVNSRTGVAGYSPSKHMRVDGNIIGPALHAPVC